METEFEKKKERLCENLRRVAEEVLQDKKYWATSHCIDKGVGESHPTCCVFGDALLGAGYADDDERSYTVILNKHALEDYLGIPKIPDDGPLADCCQLVERTNGEWADSPFVSSTIRLRLQADLMRALYRLEMLIEGLKESCDD